MPRSLRRSQLPYMASTARRSGLGDRCVVVGAGMIGSLTIQAARLAGAIR